MEEIAHRVGVSVGTLYRYFDGGSAHRGGVSPRIAHRGCIGLRALGGICGIRTAGWKTTRYTSPRSCTTGCVTAQRITGRDVQCGRHSALIETAGDPRCRPYLRWLRRHSLEAVLDGGVG
ncbi:TetR family transcriptional regulator [Nocardia sp. BMG51109]|uniref:TetR family transcriptional regulator n=1 Tax=Nocardia sp. BMG51109 TaxID=1056816 RepID=UPI00350F9613